MSRVQLGFDQIIGQSSITMHQSKLQHPEKILYLQKRSLIIVQQTLVPSPFNTRLPREALRYLFGAFIAPNEIYRLDTLSDVQGFFPQKDSVRGHERAWLNHPGLLWSSLACYTRSGRSHEAGPLIHGLRLRANLCHRLLFCLSTRSADAPPVVSFPQIPHHLHSNSRHCHAAYLVPTGVATL